MENPQMNRQVFREINYFCHTYNLVPKVYLSYERRAYFEKNDGDFRVTFDKNITTRREDVRLESGSYGQQLLPENTYLMEIKINRQCRCGLQGFYRNWKFIPYLFQNTEQNIKNMLWKIKE